jgi:hypothetical protein
MIKQMLVCSICRKPMKGALIEPESEIGRKLSQLIGAGAVHDNCIRGSHQKQDTNTYQ